jgi:uncharacterized protein (DUF1778 family)
MRIRHASEILHKSMSRFIVEAATDRAEQVIAEATFTTVPSDYFDSLLAALDEPPRSIRTLAQAAKRVHSEPAFEQAG